jgi:hypothetical protein
MTSCRWLETQTAVKENMKTALKLNVDIRIGLIWLETVTGGGLLRKDEKFLYRLSYYQLFRKDCAALH